MKINSIYKLFVKLFKVGSVNIINTKIFYKIIILYAKFVHFFLVEFTSTLDINISNSPKLFCKLLFYLIFEYAFKNTTNININCLKFKLTILQEMFLFGHNIETHN